MSRSIRVMLILVAFLWSVRPGLAQRMAFDTGEAAPAAVTEAKTIAEALEQAALLNKAGKYAAALDLLIGAHQQSPEDAQVIMQIGETYHAMGNDRKTLEYWEPLAAKYTHHVGLRNNIAHIYVHSADEALRDPAKAINYARDALLKDPLAFRVWITLGEAYAATGDYAKSLHAAKRSLELAELVQATPEELAECATAIRQTEPLARAVADHPLPPAEDDEMDELYWVKLGEYAMSKGRYRESLGAYGIALTHNPENRAALFGQALVYIATKQHELAIELLSTLNERYPNDFSLKNNLAWLYATSEDSSIRDAAKAVAFAQDALLIAPNNYQVWSTLAEAYFVAGNYERSLRAAENAMRQAQQVNATAQQLDTYRRQIERSRVAADALSITE